jgi:hypothetical protein
MSHTREELEEMIAEDDTFDCSTQSRWAKFYRRNM